ncbi:unnamed protein product [Effrenium voratum]|nr:unnamed protein product [Effrenium voratum]
MQKLLAQADVGLHTMRDEHFGISVVEFMAAGAVVVAHNSAGPAMDIVTPLPDGRRTGLLATDDDDYARQLKVVLDDMSAGQRLEMAAAAREAVRHRFSQEVFEEVVAERAELRPSQPPRNAMVHCLQVWLRRFEPRGRERLDPFEKAAGEWCLKQCASESQWSSQIAGLARNCRVRDVCGLVYSCFFFVWGGGSQWQQKGGSGNLACPHFRRAS